MSEQDAKDKTLPIVSEDQQPRQACNAEKNNEKYREISTREAYFASLDNWVKRANIAQNAMAMFPWYLFNSYPHMFQQHVGLLSSGTSIQLPNVPTNANNSIPNANINTNVANAAANAPSSYGFRILDEQAQTELITRNGGYECVIAPFWKRAIAELIDVFILLLLKVLITFTIMNIFDMDLGFDLDKDIFRKAMTDDDYSDFFSLSLDFLAFSSDLLLLEIITKLIVCFYEAIWTSVYNGATPGKAVMSLRIKYVEAILPLQLMPAAPQLGFLAPRRPLRALILPADTPSFKRAFMRALAKNMIMTLLFPVCFVMVFFKNNRTAYDIMTKTVVIEANVNPVLRRQQ